MGTEGVPVGWLSLERLFALRNHGGLILSLLNTACYPTKSNDGFDGSIE